MASRGSGAGSTWNPLLRTDQSRRAGRDGFEEVANQEQIVQPITKYTWLARRADMIPETVRRAFKAAWTPPYGPSYISWHSDYNDERIRSEIIPQDQFDPRMRVRPNPDEVSDFFARCLPRVEELDGVLATGARGASEISDARWPWRARPRSSRGP